MFKKALATSIIAIAVLVAAPAGAQYEPTIEVTISTTELVPGEVFTIAGNVDSFFDEETKDDRAFTDASTVKVLFEDQELGQLQVQSDRGFAGEFTTPDVAPGSYTVHVQYLDSERDIPVQVLGQSATPFTNGTTTGGGATGSGSSGSGSGSSGSGSTGTGGLARTGSETLPLVLSGSALVLAGAALYLTATKRRRAAA